MVVGGESIVRWAGLQQIAAASHSLDKGAPLHLVQKKLGYSSITITERYLHAHRDDSSGLYLPEEFR